MKTIALFILMAAIVVVVVGCSNDTSLPGQPPSVDNNKSNAPATPTINPNVTPLVAAATDTPLPPPPTPTARPTATTAPTNPPAPTKAGATTAADATAAATSTSAPAAGVDTPMIAIPAGSFQMGSDAGNADSKPPHKVDVAAFQIDSLEATNADFKQFVDATGYQTDAEKIGDKPWSAFAAGKDNNPVVKVSWNDAGAFCQWAGKRLPTEAEWEFAARGADALAFPYGNAYDAKKQNGKDSGLRGTAVVGSYPGGASPFQLLDMAGNVAEWTSSKPEHYPGNTTNSKLYGDNVYIIRGGGWFSAQDQLASYYRNSAVPTTANDDLGFRCAK